MNLETPFACVRTDNGIVSELLHVSPVFVRCGPPRRGSFAERRSARAQRSDARHERRTAGRVNVDAPTGCRLTTVS